MASTGTFSEVLSLGEVLKRSNEFLKLEAAKKVPNKKINIEVKDQ